jgi:AraC-like DNA-binding protein
MRRAIAEPRRSKPDGQSFVAFAYATSAFRFWWHHHPEIELTWIESGAGTRFVGDSIAPFHPGDLVLLGGNLPHTWSSEGRAGRSGSHRAIVVHFPSDLFDVAATEFTAVRALLRGAHRGIAFSTVTTSKVSVALKRLVALRGLEAWSQLATILHTLAQDRQSFPLASAGYAPSDRHGAQRRLERALAYIDTHVRSPTLSAVDIARTVHMSPAAFSRFFRQQTGGTLVQHINQLRIGLACRRLSESDDSVAEIAFACGFGNLANFNRRFRAIKRMTPTEFRRPFSESVSR